MRSLLKTTSVALITLFSFVFAQDVYLTLDGSNLNYESSADIYGFQFSHDGCAIDGSGGDSADAGFTNQCSGSVCLGFSLTGAFIPAGSGVLLGNLDCDDGVLSNFVLSSSDTSTPLDVVYSAGGDSADHVVSLLAM